MVTLLLPCEERGGQVEDDGDHDAEDDCGRVVLPGGASGAVLTIGVALDLALEGNLGRQYGWEEAQGGEGSALDPNHDLPCGST